MDIHSCLYVFLLIMSWEGFPFAESFPVTLPCICKLSDQTLAIQLLAFK